MPAGLYHNTAEYHAGPDPYASIRPGKYVAMINEAKEMMSKSSGVPYVALSIEIMDGEYKSRKIWDNLSVNSPNEIALSIAKKKLNEIAMSIGVSVIEGAETFLYKEIGIDVSENKEGKIQVRRYIPAKEAKRAVATAPKIAPKPMTKAQVTDDEVPF